MPSATSPDLHVVSSASQQGAAPDQTYASAALAEDTPQVGIMPQSAMPQPSPMQRLLIEGVLAGAAGGAIGASTAPKSRRGMGAGIGFLAGSGFYALTRGIRPDPSMNQAGFARLGALGLAAAALGTAGWLAFR